jgi:hypothetical protein
VKAPARNLPASIEAGLPMAANAGNRKLTLMFPDGA